MRQIPATDGDIKIEMTNGEGDISFVDGQPVLDRGFITAIIISLYTESGFWGNVIEPDPAYNLGSGYIEAISAPITSGSLRAAEAAATDALAWLVSSGIAKSVSVSIDNPSADRLKITVSVTKPDGSNLLWEYTP